jgi:hypothetical protein
MSDAAFDAAVGALALNAKSSLLTAKSGAQVKESALELSNVLTTSSVNPLLADAEARSKK